MPSDRQPNILVIMSDQHSKHFLGCYGNEIVRTPNLDRLAAEGMLFSDAYCPSPLCVPSRMSFMTGRTPTRNRVWCNNHVLSSGIPAWPHVLGAAGYETALIGRMHFNGPDQRHGFEHRPIGAIHSKHIGSTLRGGPLWANYSPGTCGQVREAVEIAGRGTTHYQWFDTETTRAACEYLRAKASPRADARPFAAVVGYMLPHCPFIAPKDLFDYYYDKVDIPDVEADQPQTITQFRKMRDIHDPPLDPERVRVARAAYYGLCEYVDSLVGEVLAALAESGRGDNTLVIYTSDHGEAAGEHGCWWKSNYYESSVSVPMIAHMRGTVAEGTVSPAVCNLIDLAATFAEISGGRFGVPIDGRSLWATLQGDHPDTWADETFSELTDFRTARAASRMIRRGPWKLWVFGDGSEWAPHCSTWPTIPTNCATWPATRTTPRSATNCWPRFTPAGTRTKS